MEFRNPSSTPCKEACPVNVDVPSYVRAISQGKYNAAISIIREKLPFPSLCGRICFHPCEDKCNCNNLLDRGPIAISALKRFAAEQGVFKDIPPEQFTGKKIAVVGSGPAGLTAAYYLRKIGHGVTVFEKLSEPGGMVRYGIPDYRLPKDILAHEIQAIEEIGVSIRTNAAIRAPDILLEEGFDAVFVATGAHKNKKLGIPGEDLPGVLNSILFMRDLNSGRSMSLGEKVLVVGGGNAAVDVARSALRLGCKDVVILYRRSREEMPAWSHEVEEAIREGVKIEFLSLPVMIKRKQGRLRVHCLRTQLGEIDEKGRRLPVHVPGSEFIMEAGNIIYAVGQELESFKGSRLSVSTRNLIEVDPDCLSTSMAGIFAGGDAVSGPATVIDAIAAGRKAAVSIDRYLGGNGEIDLHLPRAEEKILQSELQGIPVGCRNQAPNLPIVERLNGFSAVELGFNEEQARTEASRCLRCDLPIAINAQNCTGCQVCLMRCSLRFSKSFSPREAKISIIPYSDGRVNEISFKEGCDTCGICARYCPQNALCRVAGAEQEGQIL